MDEQKFSLSGSFRKTKEYIDTQIELMKLQAIDRISPIFGGVIVGASKVVVILFIVFFLSMALGFYLGEVLGSNALGFLATGGIFMLIWLILTLMKRSIQTKFTDSAVRKFYAMFDKDKDDDEATAHNFDTTKEQTEGINVDQQEDERKDY